MNAADAGADYRGREYLSTAEVAALTGLATGEIHRRVKAGALPAFRAASGQYRFRLREIRAALPPSHPSHPAPSAAAVVDGDARGDSVAPQVAADTVARAGGTVQRVIVGDARDLSALPDDSVHLALTSPPYFNAKMYSDARPGDLGDIHDLDEWLEQIGRAWAEVLRALAPGRKFFLNIMNLPVRANGSFRALNLVGKSADLCERAGFVFKRDIVWHKTNGVRAHFGTFPHPGGILLNNMHEFVLEFEKPAPKGVRKYAHVSAAQRAASKLDREFWLSLKNTDVWLMKPEKSGGRREHAAPFPPELPERLIRAYSFVGETVLDPFLGSGATLAAAARWGRNGVGVDINPAFCEMARRRVAAVERELL